MTKIEEAGFSTPLYEKLKRKGIHYIEDIKGVNYRALTKSELAEIVTYFFFDIFFESADCQQPDPSPYDSATKTLFSVD